MGTFFLLCTLALSVGCNDDKGLESPGSVFVYDFEQGGMADFPKDWNQSRLEFEFAHDHLPAEVDEEWKAMRLSGLNLSDDLFMFMKKRLTRLKPNHTYRVTFQIELASQYPEASVGIGGSPGTSVYLKAGGSATEPIPVAQDDYIR